MGVLPLSTPDTLQASFCTTRVREFMRRALSCYPVTSWSDVNGAGHVVLYAKVMPGVTHRLQAPYGATVRAPALSRLQLPTSPAQLPHGRRNYPR